MCFWRWYVDSCEWESDGRGQYPKRVQKGYHLAPFIFLLVAEGFSCLMRNALSLNLIEGFRFKRYELVFSHMESNRGKFVDVKSIVERFRDDIRFKS